MTAIERPPLSSLACVNSAWEGYGQSGQDNLTVRKVYGKDHIRFLRCHHCGQEFSERKNTALWNTKIPEARAIDVGRHLAEGVSLKGTARLTYSHRDTVKRLLARFGHHAQAFQPAVDDVEIGLLVEGIEGQPEAEALRQRDFLFHHTAPNKTVRKDTLSHTKPTAYATNNHYESNTRV